MSRLRAMLPLLLLIITGVVLFASGALDRFHPVHLLAEQASWRADVLAHPWLTRLAYIGLLTVVVSTGIPGSVLVNLTGGFLFGVVEGTILSSIGQVLGSLLLFLASRYAFGAGRRAAPRLVERLRHGFAAHPANYTLFLRFVPVFPFGAVTVALAWLRCPLWLFIGATALGGGIILMFESALGAGLGKAVALHHGFGLSLLIEPRLLWPLGALAILALVPLAFQHRERRRRRQRKH
ncbi:VTT domain-containing protein [Oleiagrimonas sp. C23AA]|uniref:TVP38/TMEM64 family protein n=1 Tax=Oleiagrimonas sp. C23AA TaxID=2719047 RepID=UPI001420BE89|nr:VTT domain-containing protein [Oleiagrimonas sp. C23AA]NII09984.1 TVP38/TMEM64 family protein [Oleiagrimonas sp. C23AA]